MIEIIAFFRAPFPSAGISSPTGFGISHFAFEEPSAVPSPSATASSPTSRRPVPPSASLAAPRNRTEREALAERYYPGAFCDKAQGSTFFTVLRLFRKIRKVLQIRASQGFAILSFARIRIQVFRFASFARFSQWAVC